jgi:hypothetical protein
MLQRGARARAWTRSRVRHRRLLQIGRHAGRAEREMGGGVGSVPRGGRKTGERGGSRAWHGSTDRGVGMAPGGAVEGGSARSRWRRAGEQGRETWCGTARLIGGAGGQRSPVSAVRCGRETGKKGSTTAGHRQAGPTSTVPGSVVQTRF